MLDLGHIKKYVSFPPADSKVFIWISGPLPSSLFPLLLIQLREWFCKHVFRLLLVAGLLQKETTDMENCHYKIEFFWKNILMIMYIQI
jgi:hypothetical protein